MHLYSEIRLRFGFGFGFVGGEGGVLAGQCPGTLLIEVRVEYCSRICLDGTLSFNSKVTSFRVTSAMELLQHHKPYVCAIYLHFLELTHLLPVEVHQIILLCYIYLYFFRRNPLCEQCEAAVATVYCLQDDARLCDRCDYQLHSKSKVCICVIGSWRKCSRTRECAFSDKSVTKELLGDKSVGTRAGDRFIIVQVSGSTG